MNRSATGNSQKGVGLALDWLYFLLLLFERKLIGASEPTIFPDAPHVIREKQQHTQRQEETMQNIESDERVLVDRAAAQQEETQTLADKRRRRCYVRANGDGPISKLIPGQQIACK